jgi:hypothetical protein
MLVGLVMAVGGLVMLATGVLIRRDAVRDMRHADRVFEQAVRARAAAERGYVHVLEMQIALRARQQEWEVDRG